MKTVSINQVSLVGCVIVLLLGLSSAAEASTFGVQGIDNLSFLYETASDTRPGTPSSLKDQVYHYNLAQEGNPLAGLSGEVEAMYLGSEAGNMNTLNDSSGMIFDNRQDMFASTAIDLGSTFFQDTIDGPGMVSLLGSSDLDIYSMGGSALNTYTHSNRFDVEAGYYVIGFGDGFGDKDYDDFVIAIKEPMHAQIPTSVLLLGSGIMGLIGLGLRRRNAKLS